MRPLFEAITLEARDEMHVWMEDRLPGVFAVVHHEINAIGLKRSLDRAGDDAYGLHHQCPIVCGDVEHVRRVRIFRNDERVATGYRMDVEEGERFIGFVDFVGGDISTDDFAEDTVVHADKYNATILRMEADVVSDLVRTLLARRGVVEPEVVAAFLTPDYGAHTHDPFLLVDMDKAVARIFDAMQRDERIAIYADFDCDGIPGASLTSDFFEKIGYRNVEVYLPHRDREGYGFHNEAIAQLAARDVKLIITIDVGTVAFDGVTFANTKGIEVIVTDHHEITDKLPDAYAILNPKRGRYPFPDLCGAAVAFKLVCALLIEGKRRGLKNFLSIPEGWEKWLLDLVALATVADMVPLIGENRVLAYWGLTVLRKSPRAGIIALCNQLRLKKNELTEDEIGFSIAPRINAASRMDEPDLALRLLTTHDTSEAEKLATHLEELNTRRKGIVAGIVRSARKRVHERYASSDRIVAVGDTAWKPALLGLAANSIMNDRGGLVCLWGRDVEGNLKGSCRSDGVIPIPGLFAAARDSFIECGGHNASGGFSVSHEHALTLADDLVRAAASLRNDSVTSPPDEETSDHDAVVTLAEISWPLLREVSHLAPFGIGNPKPIFRIARATVTSVKSFGKEKNHVEFMLGSEDDGAAMRAFDFFRTAKDFSHEPIVGTRASILATLERDSFRSPAHLALRVIDVVPE